MRKIATFMLIICIGSRLYAQTRAVVADITYTTEFQSDFKDHGNWVHLLALNAQLSTEAIGAWRGGFIDMELISIYRTSKERILDDWQTFSNIDEQNQPLGLFTLGYTQKMGRADLFLGLRNVNRDYFTTPYTSMFTNSSCGIPPTVSANYPLANYPLSAMCLHTEYQVDDHWHVKSSLYNGIAYGELSKVLTVDPKRDGVFNITQLSYTQQSTYYGNYNLGAALHSSMAVHSIDYSLWANMEQCVYANNEREIGVLAQCSFAPSNSHLCSEYYGIGLLFNGWITNSKRDQLGVFINKTKFDNESERALELTWKYQIRSNLEIQPALHFIENRGNIMTAGLFRISYALNF